MISDGLYEVPAGKVAMIVTHLEMLERADTRDVPLPDGVAFRKVAPDVAWYRDIFDRVGADWLWYGRRKIDDAKLAQIISDPNVDIYTLSLNGQDEALLELDFCEDGACELAYFGLTSKLIGTGAGRYLMNKAIALAWAKPISRFHVHTCTIDSQQALSFYVRSGFVPYKRQVEIDDDPRLQNLLPEDVAPHLPVIR
ncbi:GNAT family N-acetyltransferase [Sulfitobacter sp. JBTF-M27]|uniref:GNAT family N-acetyltransferase n=1 Tax=Sulfitobacter sediminilitoris TaxID=2698830 RepID=A0A6P0C8R8_9RHOB|nr:GNAT family N-acetyltransferase [Sulfitobacter sediminilitoris]NEK21810.1 GNAT family N-acetyltransferase [Sulfitobacter sediminilitoris]